MRRDNWVIVGDFRSLNICRQLPILINPPTTASVHKPPAQLALLSMARAITSMADVFRFQVLELFEILYAN
jgi:hypothetical protein